MIAFIAQLLHKILMKNPFIFKITRDRCRSSITLIKINVCIFHKIVTFGSLQNR